MFEIKDQLGGSCEVRAHKIGEKNKMRGAKGKFKKQLFEKWFNKILFSVFISLTISVKQT